MRHNQIPIGNVYCLFQTSKKGQRVDNKLLKETIKQNFRVVKETHQWRTAQRNAKKTEALK